MPDTQFDRIPPTDTDARPGTVLYAAERPLISFTLGKLSTQTRREICGMDNGYVPKRDARRADGHEDDSDYRSERDTREKDTPISRSPL